MTALALAPPAEWYGHNLCVADLDDDYWTMADIAEHLGVKLRTVHTYRHRGQQGDPNGLPPEDKTLGRTPVWRPTTITGWRRPGQGSGGGRPRKDEP